MTTNERNRRGSPEARIRHTIVKDLRSWGFAVWDLEQNRPTRQTAGLADLYAAGRGMVVWIEVKTDTGRQTPAQRRFEEEVTANGGRYLLARSSVEVAEYLIREEVLDATIR